MTGANLPSFDHRGVRRGVWHASGAALCRGRQSRSLLECRHRLLKHGIGKYAVIWRRKRKHGDRGLEEIAGERVQGVVKVLTYHSAKGLEWPVCVCCDTTACSPRPDSLFCRHSFFESLCKNGASQFLVGFLYIMEIYLCS